MEKIDEGNKLIQEFMGWELINLEEDDLEDDIECWCFKNKETGEMDSGCEGLFYNENSIKDFTQSWDNLKPSIDKCFIELKKLGIDNRGGYNLTYGYSPNILSLRLNCTINEAWESVVFSVKFINEKNKG